MMWWVYRNAPPPPGAIIRGRYRYSDGIDERTLKVCQHRCCVVEFVNGEEGEYSMVPPDEWQYPHVPVPSWGGYMTDPWRDYRTDPPGPGSYIIGRYLDSSGAWHEGNLRTCSKRPPCCVTSAEDVAFALWTMRPPEQWRYPDETVRQSGDENAGR